MASGNVPEAIVVYRAALESGPHAAAQRALGLAYARDQRQSLALLAFDAALDGLPDDPASLVGKSQALASMGQIAAAHFHLLQLLQKQPTHALALALLALYSTEPKQLQQAVAFHRTYLADNSSSVTRANHEILADLLLRLKLNKASNQQRKLARFAKPPSTNDALTVARAALEMGRTALALQLLEELAAGQTSNSKLQLLLAAIHLKLGDWAQSEAALVSVERVASSTATERLRAQLQLAVGFRTTPIVALRQLVADQPDPLSHESTGLRRDLAAALRLQGQFSEAKELLKPLLEHPQARFFARIERARIAVAEGQSQAALEWLMPVAKPGAGNPQYQHLRGTILLGLSDWQGAVLSFRRVHMLVADRPGPSWWLAKALRLDGKNSDALQLLTDNLLRFPDHTPSILSWAEMSEKTAGVEKTEAALNRLSTVNPRLAAVASALGQWHSQRDHQAKALTSFRRAMDLHSMQATDLTGLSLGYFRAGRVDLALAALEATHSTNSHKLSLVLAIARLYTLFDRPGQAQSTLQTSLKLYPQHPALNAELAILWAQDTSHKDQAFALASAAVAENKSSAFALGARGWVLHHQKQDERAQQDLARALELSSSDARLHYFHGVTLAALARRNPAQAAFSKALSLDPYHLRAGDMKKHLSEMRN